MREDRMNRLVGSTVVAEAPPEDVVADDATTADEPKLPSPDQQLRIMNPDEIELRAEVLVRDWTCHRGHATRRLDEEPKPVVCGTCGSNSIADEPVESVDVQWYRLRLAFTRHDERRRRVWDHVEHLVKAIRAELLRYDTAADITLAWLELHRGYYERALSAPVVRKITIDTLEYLALCPRALVEGISNANLTIAAMALVNMHTRRIEEMNASRKEPATTSAAS